MALTISGDSQFIGDPGSQRQRQVMLQLFLAISAFSALIIAAISRQHQLALLTVRQSERGLQQLIDAVPANIWCTTPGGIPNYLNQRATDITGIALDDLIAADGSRSLADVHPDDRDATDEALAHSFRTGASFVGRYRQRRANGPHRWVEGRAEPLRDESGVRSVVWRLRRHRRLGCCAGEIKPTGAGALALGQHGSEPCLAPRRASRLRTTSN